MSKNIQNPYISKQALVCLLFSFLLLIFYSCKEKPKKENSDLKHEVLTSDTHNLRRVTFMPYWTISTQFAGYYIAKEMGIYNKYGINLTFIPFAFNISPSEYLQNKKVDFVALWLVNAMEMKDTGVDIVNIVQFSSRSSLMLVAKKSSGIKTIHDINGKRIGVWKGYELQPEALCKKYNLNGKFITIGSTNNLFLKNGIDLTLANWFDEYHYIINSGFDPGELSTFFFADYGLNFPEDGIYCMSAKTQSDPGLCSDFVKATIEGWQWAFDHPEKAVDIVARLAREAKTPVNKAHLRWMLDRYKDLMIPKGETGINIELSEKDYLQVGSELQKNKLIKSISPFKDFFHLYTNLK